MIIYSGNKLKEHIAELKKGATAQTGLNEVYERDFVSDVRAHFHKTQWQKVVIVSGFHATGKTFGLLQAVEDFNDTVYIPAQRDETLTGRNYIEFLREVKEKNIIIDEYTLIKDKRDLTYYLWTLAENGKSVVITGADWTELDYYGAGILINREQYINVNMFSYREYCRIYRKSFCQESRNEYLRIGGVFKPYDIDSAEAMIEYIETSVVENIANSTPYSKETVRAILYHIMYLAVCGLEIEWRHDPKNIRMDAQYQRMADRFGIDGSIEFDSFDFKRTVDVLLRTAFLSKSYNLFDCHKTEYYEDWNYRLHMTNPSLTYQMFCAVFDEGQTEANYSKLLEANMVSLIAPYVKRDDKIWYAEMELQTGILEFVLIFMEYRTCSAYLFEVCSQAATLSEHIGLVSDEFEALLKNQAERFNIGGRYVICDMSTEKCGTAHGKKVIFTGLECDTLVNFRQFDESYDRLSGTDDNSNDE